MPARHVRCSVRLEGWWPLLWIGLPDRSAVKRPTNRADDFCDLGQPAPTNLPGREWTDFRLEVGVAERSVLADGGGGAGAGGRVAAPGSAYTSPSIAGATTTGAAEARQVAVTTSSARPLAIAAIHRAVAGATRIKSAESAATMCEIRWSGSSSSGSVITWRRVSV